MGVQNCHSLCLTFSQTPQSVEIVSGSTVQELCIAEDLSVLSVCIICKSVSMIAGRQQEHSSVLQGALSISTPVWVMYAGPKGSLVLKSSDDVLQQGKHSGGVLPHYTFHINIHSHRFRISTFGKDRYFVQLFCHCIVLFQYYFIFRQAVLHFYAKLSKIQLFQTLKSKVKCKILQQIAHYTANNTFTIL